MKNRRPPYFTPRPDDPPPVEVRVRHRVVFSEVDALAILWHGRYPALFEQAHTELVHHLGLTYDAFRQAGLAAPIVHLETDYLRPLHLDEMLTIAARLFWSEGAQLNVDYRIFNADDVLCATGCTRQLFVELATREPIWGIPALWETCRQRWQAGEFHGQP